MRFTFLDMVSYASLAIANGDTDRAATLLDSIARRGDKLEAFLAERGLFEEFERSLPKKEREADHVDAT